MIFVTVGTGIGFQRLIVKMDEIAGRIDEEVIFQIGATQYKPKYGEYFDFCEESSILEYIKRARVVVTHAGAGTVLNLLFLGKNVILFPRFKKYGECLDDHQLELTKMLSEKGQAVAVYDTDDLESAIKSIDGAVPNTPDRNSGLLAFLKRQFAES